MLSERYGAGLAGLLLPLDRFHPYPTAQDRPGWEAISAAARAELIAAGERHLRREWEALPATLFLEYAREGNRSRYEHRQFGRRGALAALVAAECAEGRGRFVDDIVNGIWAICEESFWGVPAHNGPSPLPDTAQPQFDLFAGETAALLAWTHHLLGVALDAVTPLVRARIRREVDRRVLTPFLERDDFWWMGLAPGGRGRMNNWNPWCNSNCLAAALLLEGDAARRAAIVAKVMRSLDRFIDPHPADGGCDEGTGYWDRAGASLFDCLELLHLASAGAIDLYGEPLVREMGRFLYRAHIAEEWYLNFADGGPRVHISADLVHRYGRRIGDAGLAGLGAAAHKRGGGLPAGLPRLLPALANRAALEADAGLGPPLLRDVWLPDLQVMAARQAGGSAAGLFVAAKGGHNAESHNHNDVGQWIVYADGQPVVVDAGVGTYTAQTFSARRYEIWTMQSAYHNLPEVGGIQQRAGREFAARAVEYRSDGARAELALDLAGAYPPEAGLRSWRRTVALVRGPQPCVEVSDDFALQGEAEVRLHLLVCREPVLAQDGEILLPGEPPVRLDYPGQDLEASAEAIDLDDARLRAGWGPRLWRLTLRARRPAAAGHLTVTLRLPPAG